MRSRSVLAEFILLAILGAVVDWVGYLVSGNLLNCWHFFLFLLLACITLSKTENGWKWRRPTHLRVLAREGVAIAAIFIVVWVGLRMLKLSKVFDPHLPIDWFLLLFFAPISEEIVYRQALFLRWTKAGMSSFASMAAISVLFVMRHLGFSLPIAAFYYGVARKLVHNDVVQFVVLQSFVSLFVGGVLHSVRYKSKSILPGWVLHTLFNAGFIVGEWFRR